MLARYHIDAWKLGQGAVLALTAALTQSLESPTACVLVALHAAYGLMWVTKSYNFRDKAFEVDVSLPVALVLVWAVLSGYLVPGVLLMQRHVEAPAVVLGLAVFLWGLGVFFHFASDMQKHTALEAKPGHLVTTGLWSLSRNINFYGELLIYLAFMLIGGAALRSIWPLVYLAFYVVVTWLPRMKKKDESLSRYPEFAAWKQRTALFIPFVK